jgi:hypothetical protein|tara:strand:+ start:3045 stop:3389 length:345 start_codon:yes stop_codon:yes gene_type:complete
MAIQPGKYNFTVQRRSDHTIPLLFKDGNNSAINLTGFTVVAQVWDNTRTTKYADFTTAYTDRAAGSVSISLTDLQTATFSPEILQYDVLLIDGSGNKEYYLEGTIFVSEGYSTT